MRVLVTLLILGLSSLGIFAQAPKEVTLTVMNTSEPAVAAIETQLIKDFEAAHPGVKVEFVSASYGEFVDKSLIMHASGVAPDVIMVHTWHILPMTAGGLLLPLNELIENDHDMDWEDLFPRVREIYTVDGEIVAIPYGYSPAGIVFYNQNHFYEAGLDDPDKEWTYEEFLHQARRLVRRGDDGIQRYGFHSYHPNNWSAMWGGSLVDDMFNPKEATFTSPEAIAGYTAFLELMTVHEVAPYRTDWGRLNPMFPRENVSMFMGGLWSAVDFADASFDWDITLPPKGPNGDGRGYEFAGRAYGVSTQSDHPELAYELAKYLAYSEEATAKRVIQPDKGVQGDMPARISLARGELFAQNNLKPYNKQVMIEVDPYLFIVPRHERGLEIFNLAKNAVDKAEKGLQALEVALAEAKAISDGYLR